MLKRIAATGLAVSLALAACGLDRSADLTATEWVARTIYIDGSPVAVALNNSPSIGFLGDGVSVRASDGCNNLETSYELVGGTIVFPDAIRSTQALCSGSKLQRATFIDVLTGTHPFAIDGDTLTIGDPSGSAVRFLDSAVANPDRSLTGTRWLGNTIYTDRATRSLTRDSQLTLFIDEASGRASGVASCNNFSARAEWVDSGLVLAELTIGEVECEAQVMEQESLWFRCCRTGYKLTSTQSASC